MKLITASSRPDSLAMKWAKEVENFTAVPDASLAESGPRFQALDHALAQ